VEDPVGRSLADCDVLVGMHPDQATEPIIDAALALGKSFAVVPCCVFPDLFPDRQTPEGTPVRNYMELMAGQSRLTPGCPRLVSAIEAEI
jgi:hypothetical protein